MFTPVGMPGLMELMVISLIVLLWGGIWVLPFWFIFEKAGFPGALSLLMLIPPVQVVMVFVLAFTPWPALGNRGQAENTSRPGGAPKA